MASGYSHAVLVRLFLLSSCSIHAHCDCRCVSVFVRNQKATTSWDNASKVLCCLLVLLGFASRGGWGGGRIFGCLGASPLSSRWKQRASCVSRFCAMRFSQIPESVQTVLLGPFSIFRLVVCLRRATGVSSPASYAISSPRKTHTASREC